MTKFYSTQEVAKILGITPAEVNKLREENKLHGYRDGMDWKFKAEDVERLRSEGLSGEPSEEPSEPDVLLSEVELGGSSKSGRVISEPTAASPAESDLRLAEPKPTMPPSAAGAKEELDLVLEDDLVLAESDIAPKKTPAPAEAKKQPSAGSDVGLAPVTEEEEVVIGGSSGAGSDVTMGADSGISLVDPSDSGLSLEEPLELAPPGEETLELGEDDMITLAEEEAADLESPTQLRSEEFDLTGLEEPGEEETESGSQVIALEEVEEGAPAAGVAARAPMLEEELVGVPSVAPLAPPFGAPPVAAPGEVPGAALVAPALPEAPYTIWNVLSLALCVMILAVTGMMMFDMIRNIWSWDSETVLSSPIMDGILSLFEK